MFVDSVTPVSLVAEHQRARYGPRGARAAELGASAFSVIASWSPLRRDAPSSAYGGEEEEDVDPAIMLGFTIVNLVDFFMCPSSGTSAPAEAAEVSAEVSLAQVQASSAQPDRPSAA